MKNFFQYVRNPVAIESPENFTFKIYFKTLGLWFFLIFDTSFLVIFLKLINLLPDRVNPRVDSLIIFLMLVVIIPLFEEILFRLNLRITRLNIALFFTVLLIVIMKLLYFGDGEFLIYLGVIPLFPMIYYLIRISNFPVEKAGQLVKSNFKYLFHFLAIFFGMLHLFNYETVYWWMILLFPFLTAPYIAMGYILGYTRMKYGFSNGWLIHSSINFIYAFIAMPKHFM